MDSQERFFDEAPIDRTPYASFTWVAIAVAVVFGAGSYGLVRASSAVKGQRWLRSVNVNGATDAVVNGTQDAATQALEAAKNAAEKKADDAANAAAAAATQKVLEQSDAAIKQGTDAVKQAADDTTVNATAAPDEEFQKYLK